MINQKMICTTCGKELTPWGKHLIKMIVLLIHNPLGVTVDEKRVLETNYYCDNECMGKEGEDDRVD